MNHVHKQGKQHAQGFTLIELMLAMTFISFLLIGIALAVMQMTGTYNRGLALKEVNQAARAVSASVHEAAGQGATVDYIATNVDGNGRMCLGSYTYIWNTSKAFHGGVAITYDSDPNRVLQLVRIPDPTSEYCKRPTGPLTYKNIRASDTGIVQELVDPGEHALAVSKVELVSPVSDNRVPQTLYTMNYGIIAGDINSMKPDLSACLETSVTNSNINYCVVQQFSIVLKM